ncbi:hypothetical protein KC19_VG043500 [Ceratodon purpureus]|uniref:Uncharacterized protein n=1 Tax=Ceratodon purpureus TaxID=3225 RepID=A0A8T0HMD4_CERPU|nr:hypothetical protein KC19_VG043500 [Ceratodon purpureus]
MLIKVHAMEVCGQHELGCAPPRSPQEYSFSGLPSLERSRTLPTTIPMKPVIVTSDSVTAPLRNKHVQFSALILVLKEPITRT